MEFILFIIVIVVFVFCKKQSKIDKNDLNSMLPRNLPLQYMYTIDEWYRLRCEFDKEIEAAWELYRVKKISKEKYREESWAAVRRIIPADKRSNFQNLYRYGCYLAAMRVIEEGYMPGYMEYAIPTKGEMTHWRPTEYIPNTPGNRGSWMRCIPGAHSILDLYPEGQYLDYMGCGRMKNGFWTPECREDAWCKPYYSCSSDDQVSSARRSAISAFQQRGFNGYRYVGEPDRNFGDLTLQEISNKYEFLQHKPDMMRDDHDADCKCVINKDHYEFKPAGRFLYQTID